jgi:hypothetical protein
MRLAKFILPSRIVFSPNENKLSDR